MVFRLRQNPGDQRSQTGLYCLNTNPFAIFDPRGFGAAEKPIFQVVWVYINAQLSALFWDDWVAGKAEMLQLSEVADRIWDHCDLVVGKVEQLQLSESADIWDRCDLVAGKSEPPQLSESTDLIWDHCD